MLNTHWARRKAILYFKAFIHGLSSNNIESLVTDVQYTVLICFHIITQCSKVMHYFHRVVGLVVDICQWLVVV